MALPKLTRSPGLTYTWMVISIAFVVMMFSRWDSLLAHGRQVVWWSALSVFLLLDFFFLLTPIQDSKSLRRLSRSGKLWAAAAWALVLVFLILVIPANHVAFRLKHPLWVTGAALLLLACLLVAIIKISKSWEREYLRSIVARQGGGFLIRFQPNDEFSAAISAIPGAARLGADDSWSVPAEPIAAAELLRFAKKYDFDFVPLKSRRLNLEEIIGV